MSKRVFASALIVMVMLLVLPLQVFAMQETTVEIPFSIQNAKGTVIIEAIDDAPLPEVTKFQDVESGVFEMTCSEPDTYRYLVYQIAGDEDNVSYDETVYDVIVSVLVNEAGALYSVVTVCIHGTTDKPDDLSFANEIIPPEESTSSTNPPKTGDDSNLPLLATILSISIVGLALVLFLFMRTKNTEQTDKAQQ